MGSDVEQNALLPLTVFDLVFQQTTFVTGWLVEGTIDEKALSYALDRLTQKWRMLAGRLHSIKSPTETKWFIRIPLGPIPDDYRTYALTTEISQRPLSSYVSIPIPQISNSPPPAVFCHPLTPRQYTAWESADYPLTCWHLTYFPASANGGTSYTGIGFARSHGIFDGVGAALVMNALVAEMRGQEWAVPPLPSGGLTSNAIQEALDLEAGAEEENMERYPEYNAYTSLGLGGLLKVIAWHVGERYWRGADRRIILLPKNIVKLLVDDVRSTLQRESQVTTHVTTGDILTAWIFKTIYSSGIDPNTLVHCTNLASFRSLLPSKTHSLADYPHNAFIPAPYPLMSAADLSSSPLHELCNVLATSRLSLTTSHVIQAYTTINSISRAFPNNPAAGDTLVISNVSGSRILESDWSPVGAKRTLCSYRYQLTPHKLLLTNAVFISGRLDDGSVVIDVTLTEHRLSLLVAEINRLGSSGSGFSDQHDSLD